MFSHEIVFSGSSFVLTFKFVLSLIEGHSWKYKISQQYIWEQMRIMGTDVKYEKHTYIKCIWVLRNKIYIFIFSSNISQFPKLHCEDVTHENRWKEQFWIFSDSENINV